MWELKMQLLMKSFDQIFFQGRECDISNSISLTSGVALIIFPAICMDGV